MSKALIAIDKSKSYRVYITITTDMVQQAADIHDTTPLASAGLGRVLTAAGLMGIMLKNDDEKLTVNFKGDGPAKQILATAYGDGSVKGYIANPYVDLPLKANGKLDVGGSLGTGELTVIKDLGLKEPYIGTIALASGEIADDLTAYFFISEQQNSSVALGVKVERDLSIGAAGGMVIQMLPDAEEGAIDALEAMIGKMEPLTTIISRVAESSAGMTEAGMVQKLLE
ncbi:MAG: Hsp33 family molecular chaperone HslO, partial [Clostridia bacterium]